MFLPSLLQFLALLISLGRSKFLSDIILFLSEEISLIFLGVQDCFIIHSLSFCLLEKVFIYISFSKDISDSFFFFFQYIKDITLLCSDWHSFWQEDCCNSHLCSSVIGLFFSGCLRNFSLSLVFSSLTMMCLGARFVLFVEQLCLRAMLFKT